MKPRYPVYIPTKGRAQTKSTLTFQALEKDDVPFFAVVEPQEASAYRSLLGDSRVLVLPFSNQGQGSIPARNWIRDHAQARGVARHWQLDDNMPQFYRLWNGHRIPCHAGVALRVCEDLADRFANVGIAGLNYSTFVNPQTREPFAANRHVYSCTLVNHNMPYRWRGKLNEDTDLCLQALTGGWATILVNAFVVRKTYTMTLGGGNTDELYRQGEVGDDGRDTAGRYEMARALERQWPGIVKVSRRFGRYQHSVNWRAFTVPLRLRPGLDLAALPSVDNYGLELRALKDVRSNRVRALPDEYRSDTYDGYTPAPLWRGLPAFRGGFGQARLVVRCKTDEDRAALIERLGITISRSQRGTLSGWWPPRPLNDYSALRFAAAEST